MPNVIKQIVKDGDFGTQTIKMIVRDNERGPQGEQGESGQAATIAAGQAYNIPFGQQPAVMNTGTSSNAVFDFYIPRGEKGDKGDQGIPGKDGKDGTNGTNGKDGAVQYTAGNNIAISPQNIISTTIKTFTTNEWNALWT